VSGFLFGDGGNILESQQYGDTETGRFCTRTVFSLADTPALATLSAEMATIATHFGMQASMRGRSPRRRVVLLASRFDHCLVDVLYRWRIGELSMDIVAIVSSHPRGTYGHLDFSDIPFHYLPASRYHKAAHESRLLALIEQARTELAVLARYMHILSGQLAVRLSDRCINIHHPFLPGLKGARPYHHAHARGVKLIGATAHSATSDLDGGSVLEQDTHRASHRVSHHDTPTDLIRIGAISSIVCRHRHCAAITTIGACSTASVPWCSRSSAAVSASHSAKRWS
jgi:formyltetrahydrofolate deformylase